MSSKAPIAIVYIITQLELGGAQKVCLSLFDKVGNKNGMRTLLIAGSYGPLATNTLKNNPDVFLLPELRQTGIIEGVWHELKCIVRLTRLLRKIKKKYPNLIVHTHSTKAGIFGRWAALFAGIHTRIHTVHGYAIHAYSPWPFWLLGYLCELFTRIITTHFIYVSSHDLHEGSRLFWVPVKKQSTIRAAVDNHQFLAARPIHNPPMPQNIFIFGTVACFKPQKNIFDLLEAFYLLYQQRNNCRLEAIGDGTLRPHIEQWIRQRNLSTVITLHGWQQQVAPIMAQWHAFTLSSLWEGLPCAVIEARLLGLPVISYRTGGIPDVIIHGKNGFLVTQKNIIELSHRMAQCMQDKKLYQSLCTHKDNLQQFGLDYMVKEHAKLYKKQSI